MRRTEVCNRSADRQRQLSIIEACRRRQTVLHVSTSPSWPDGQAHWLRDAYRVRQNSAMAIMRKSTEARWLLRAVWRATQPTIEAYTDRVAVRPGQAGQGKHTLCSTACTCRCCAKVDTRAGSVEASCVYVPLRAVVCSLSARACRTSLLRAGSRCAASPDMALAKVCSIGTGVSWPYLANISMIDGDRGPCLCCPPLDSLALGGAAWSHLRT